MTSIGEGAFEGCTKLKSIVIPQSVKSIGDGAFCLCESLFTVEIPESVTEIGYGAFMYCYASVSTPAGSYAEKYCKEWGITLVAR